MGALRPESYLSDFDFIIGEIVRFALMSVEELRIALKEHWLYDIIDARGLRRTLGKPATQTLLRLTEDTLRGSAYDGRLSIDRALKAVKDGFGKHYVDVSAKRPTEEQFRADLVRWLETAGADCGPRVHYIPCDFGLDGATPLTVGPLTVMSNQYLREHLSNRMEAYAADGDDQRSRLREDAEEYYSSFLDTIEVKVPSSDGPTSKASATAAAQMMVDFIHFLVGAGYTERMRLGGAPIWDVRSEVTITPKKDISITQSRRWGGAHIAKQWWDQFSSESNADLRSGLEAVLNAVVEGRNLPLLGARFADGCSWYGDGSREPSSPSAIVKYSTAMERLLWAGERQGGTTKRISQRAAALCFQLELADFDTITAQVTEVYNARSAILHGRMPASDPSLSRLRHLSERLTRDLLLSWADRHSRGFTAEVSIESLRMYFDKMVDDAKRFCAEKLPARS